jgi:hypothetical protein
MKCLKPTLCPPLIPNVCPGLIKTRCPTCLADAREPKPCGVATASGGQGVTRTRHALGPDSGLVRITYDMYGIPDRLDCYYQGFLVATTGGLVSGTGEIAWVYNPGPGDPQWCLVIVSAPQSGTAWEYTMQCPA